MFKAIAQLLLISTVLLCAAPYASAQSISAGGVKGDDGSTAEASCRGEALTLNQRLLTVEQFINSVVTCNQNGQVYNSATNTCITPLLSPDHTFTARDTGDTIALEQLDGTMGSPVVIGGVKGADVQCEPVPSGDCTTPWGATVADGASVTAYQTASVAYGSSCNGQTRTCTGGVLSGSYPNQNCTVSPASGCPLPWGGTINNGQNVTAYQAANVPYGSTCTSQTRSCNNGTLSGSYANQSCTVGPASTCPLPWGGTINNGQTVTAYQTASVAYGGTCTSQTRTCSNGTLSGSYANRTCTVQPAASCPLPWGGSINHGQSVTAYQSATVSSNQTCVSQTRTCNNGALGGSYANQNCTVAEPTCTWRGFGTYGTQPGQIAAKIDECGAIYPVPCSGCTPFRATTCTPGAACSGPGELTCLINQRSCGAATIWDRYRCMCR